uniref:Uncharacterized protein n=1 Tax=Anguilla anguilla TaxID=7936 RepID=A0A0E9PQG3_ANGAN
MCMQSQCIHKHFPMGNCGLLQILQTPKMANPHPPPLPKILLCFYVWGHRHFVTSFLAFHC